VTGPTMPKGPTEKEIASFKRSSDLGMEIARIVMSAEANGMSFNEKVMAMSIAQAVLLSCVKSPRERKAVSDLLASSSMDTAERFIKGEGIKR
jgi:hypothetical protein